MPHYTMKIKNSFVGATTVWVEMNGHSTSIESTNTEQFKLDPGKTMYIWASDVSGDKSSSTQFFMDIPNEGLIDRFQFNYHKDKMTKKWVLTNVSSVEEPIEDSGNNNVNVSVGPDNQ